MSHNPRRYADIRESNTKMEDGIVPKLSAQDCTLTAKRISALSANPSVQADLLKGGIQDQSILSRRRSTRFLDTGTNRSFS
jgi:hypothetical protein